MSNAFMTNYSTNGTLGLCSCRSAMGSYQWVKTWFSWSRSLLMKSIVGVFINFHKFHFASDTATWLSEWVSGCKASTGLRNVYESRTKTSFLMLPNLEGRPKRLFLDLSLKKIQILHLSCKFLTKHGILASPLQADASFARILQDNANLARW